jgi:hypothetical protein
MLSVISFVFPEETPKARMRSAAVACMTPVSSPAIESQQLVWVFFWHAHCPSTCEGTMLIHKMRRLGITPALGKLNCELRQQKVAEDFAAA